MLALPPSGTTTGWGSRSGSVSPWPSRCAERLVFPHRNAIKPDGDVAGLKSPSQKLTGGSTTRHRRTRQRPHVDTLHARPLQHTGTFRESCAGGKDVVEDGDMVWQGKAFTPCKS